MSSYMFDILLQKQVNLLYYLCFALHTYEFHYEIKGFYGIERFNGPGLCSIQRGARGPQWPLNSVEPNY